LLLIDGLLLNIGFTCDTSVADGESDLLRDARLQLKDLASPFSLTPLQGAQARVERRVLCAQGFELLLLLFDGVD